MTTVAEGYPDWQRVETRAFDPFYRQTADTGGASGSTGLLYVANFPSVIVNASGTGTATYFGAISWYTDQDKVNSLLTEQIGWGPAAWPYRVAHGVVSPWMDMFWSPFGYVAGDQLSVSLTPSTNAISQIQLSYNYLIRETGDLIAAGATTTINANAVIPGPGLIYVHTANATSYSINLQILEADGNWHSSFFYESVTIPETKVFQVTLPPRPCRVAVHNRGAGNANFDFTLTSQAQ